MNMAPVFSTSGKHADFKEAVPSILSFRYQTPLFGPNVKKRFICLRSIATKYIACS